MNMADVKLTTIRQGEVNTLVKNIKSGNTVYWQYTPGWYTIYEGTDEVAANGLNNVSLGCSIYDTGNQQFRITFQLYTTGTGSPSNGTYYENGSWSSTAPTSPKTITINTTPTSSGTGTSIIGWRDNETREETVVLNYGWNGSRRNRDFNLSASKASGGSQTYILRLKVTKVEQYIA